jgi:hypothetical protein
MLFKRRPDKLGDTPELPISLDQDVEFARRRIDFFERNLGLFAR